MHELIFIFKKINFTFLFQTLFFVLAFFQGPLRRTPPPPYHIPQQQSQHLMQNISIHPTNNSHNQSSPQSLHLNHHPQPSNAPPSLTILNNGNSNDNNNNNLSSIKSENSSTNNASHNRNNKIIIKKTSTTTITTNHSSIILTSSGVKTIVGKYNRRNNPELEKRRIHHCDYIGEFEH